MKITDMGEVFSNVTIRYPRINRCYRFDSVENKTVPADPMDDGAAYELSFEISKDEAIELHKQCMAVYAAAAQADTKRKWKEKPQYLPYREPEGDGPFMVKAKLKGAYGADKTKPPKQVDAQRKDLPSDFMLTSGSKGNVWGKLFAYNTGVVSGVSFRLRGVQVLELAEMEGGGDPFSETDGFKGGTSSGSDDPFGLPPVKQAAPSNAVFDDEIPFS